jgi:hypothetical protein
MVILVPQKRSEYFPATIPGEKQQEKGREFPDSHPTNQPLLPGTTKDRYDQPSWDHKRRETATEALDRVHVGTITGRGTVRIVLLGRTLIVLRESLTGGRNSHPMTRRVIRCAIVRPHWLSRRGDELNR